MLDALHDKMEVFIAQKLNLPLPEAREIQDAYWRQYGTTFRGLEINHGIRMEEFLGTTHDIDIEHLVRVSHSVDLLRSSVRSLPGEVVILTNGPDDYAGRVLRTLRMTHCFRLVRGANSMKGLGGSHSKPEPLAFILTLSRLHKKAQETVFVDDSLSNLKAAKRLGITTVWCVGYRGFRKSTPPSYVDCVVSDLRELSQLAGKYNGRDYVKLD